MTLRQTERAEHAPPRFGGLGALAFAVRGSPSGFRARQRTKARVLDLRQLGESVVVVAPHPDDESIACGGLIGLLARRSVVVNIIVDTDGCGSHPNSFDYPPARLAKLRAEETLSALSHLELKSAACGFAVCRPLCTHRRHSWIYRGGGSGFRLDLPLETEDPRPAVSEGHAWGPQSRSRDLATCSTVGAEPVVRMFEYIVWPSAEPLGAVPATVELEITEVLPLKQRAVTEHRSQRGLVIMDDPDGFVLPANLLARASAPYEVFFQTL